MIVVSGALEPGRAANAVACVSAAVGAQVNLLIGASARDADGVEYAGLPWAGCTILQAEPATLQEVRARAATRADVLLVDMPTSAQTERIYDDYLAAVASSPTEAVGLLACSFFGPRNVIDRLVKRIPLMA